MKVTKQFLIHAMLLRRVTRLVFITEILVIVY